MPKVPSIYSIYRLKKNIEKSWQITSEWKNREYSKINVSLEKCNKFFIFYCEHIYDKKNNISMRFDYSYQCLSEPQTSSQKNNIRFKDINLNTNKNYIFIFFYQIN